MFALLAIVVAAVAGAIGYWLGGRPAAEWRTRFEARDGEARAAEDRAAAMVPELATMSERAARAEGLADTIVTERTEHNRALDALRAENARVAGELATLKSGAAAREKALEDRLADRETQFARELARLAEAEEKLQAKFNEIGDKMLAGAQNRFLEGAQTHLAQLNKDSLDALEKKVGPVGETLERYRKRVEELEKTRADDASGLKSLVEQMRAGQDRVIDGANRISTTLKGATKARGDWGEYQFENLLEACGLSDRTDFKREAGIKGSDGQDLRPDAIINIPGNRKLVVDVKNVFNTYKEANEADSEEERRELLKKHARELRTHIQALSAKRYQDHVDGSADFVVMFVPGEHVLYAAMTHDPDLLDYALQRQVVLSSPLNFMSIAMTVGTVWRQAGVQADAQEIAKLGKELYDRLGIVARHLSNLRRDLGKANSSFDQLVGSFDTNLRRTGERFEQLNIDTSAKELHEALPLGTQPRRLANFPDAAGDGDADGAPANEAAE